MPKKEQQTFTAIPLQKPPYAFTTQASLGVLQDRHDWKGDMEGGKILDLHVLEIQNWETN